MKVLILDHTIEADSHGSFELVKWVTQDPNVTAFVRRPPDFDFPRDISLFDRVILSGSKTGARDEAPWIARLEEELRRAVERGQPILGICYGHQILMRSLGGNEVVGRSSKGEFGWTEINVIEDSPIFAGLPKKFQSLSWHFDEVQSLPQGVRHLAQSRDCKFQACEVQGKPVYSIQFHPEKDLECAHHDYETLKKRGMASRYMRYRESEKLYDLRVPQLIFKNFLGGSAL